MYTVAPLSAYLGLFVKMNTVFVGTGTEGIAREFRLVFEKDFEGTGVGINIDTRRLRRVLH